MTNKLKKEIEELLRDLDSYGYSREETLKDLEQEDSDTIWEVKKKYIELQAKLSQKQEDDERFEEFIKRLKEGLINTSDEVAQSNNEFIDEIIGRFKEE